MKLLQLLSFAILFALASFTHAATELPDLDDEDVRDDVDIRAFEIGDDGDVGSLFYVVDRTTKNCFLLARDNYPGGVAVVNCESLLSIPMIKIYWETGGLGEKKNTKSKTTSNK